jgi:cytochrome c1
VFGQDILLTVPRNSRFASDPHQREKCTWMKNNNLSDNFIAVLDSADIGAFSAGFDGQATMLVGADETKKSCEELASFPFRSKSLH